MSDTRRIRRINDVINEPFVAIDSLCSNPNMTEKHRWEQEDDYILDISKRISHIIGIDATRTACPLSNKLLSKIGMRPLDAMIYGIVRERVYSRPNHQPSEAVGSAWSERNL